MELGSRLSLTAVPLTLHRLKAAKAKSAIGTRWDTLSVPKRPFTMSQDYSTVILAVSVNRRMIEPSQRPSDDSGKALRLLIVAGALVILGVCVYWLA
jgi:hypothetical protein